MNTIRALFHKYFMKYRQFIQFLVVGVSNTAISLIVYYLLLFLDINYQIANIAAFAISSMNGYLWSSGWVFKGKRDGFSLVKFYSSYGLTFVLSIGIVTLVVEVFHGSAWIAPLVSLMFTTPINFLLNKYWTFRKNNKGGNGRHEENHGPDSNIQ